MEKVSLIFAAGLAAGYALALARHRIAGAVLVLVSHYEAKAVVAVDDVKAKLS